LQIGCRIENHVDRRQAVTIPRALVDTGSEHTWIPSKTLEKIGVHPEKRDLVFTMANGQTITRSVGFAILKVDKQFTADN
jgi:predicted aspartyl protease